jgi:hypothetical protein
VLLRLWIEEVDHAVEPAAVALDPQVRGRLPAAARLKAAPIRLMLPGS